MGSRGRLDRQSAGWFTRKPVPGDVVEISQEYTPNGPALVLDKSNTENGGTKAWASYQVQFQDGTIRWVPLITMVGWGRHDD